MMTMRTRCKIALFVSVKLRFRTKYSARYSIYLLNGTLYPRGVAGVSNMTGCDSSRVSSPCALSVDTIELSF